MRQQIAFCQYNNNAPHRYGLLSKSFNDARFPFTGKIVPKIDAAKRKAGDGLYYLKSTMDYIKYIVTKMEDQTLTGRTISTDCLYPSTESTNWLLDCDIATVGTLQRGRSGIPPELLTLKTERFLVQLAIWKMKRRKFV